MVGVMTSISCAARPLSILAVLLTSACSSATPSSADASPADASHAEDASVDVGPPELLWGVCPDRFRDQCATISVPLNHADPAGARIEIFISRRGTGARQLWLLQGGPGASAESFFGLHDFLADVDPGLEVYTLEHRGVGSSTRIGCRGEGVLSPGGRQIVEEEWVACRDQVISEWGDKLPYFSATQAAHDLAMAIELTRRPGTPVFVYGGSYGTFLANRFAVLHPTHADGIILDAPVQPGSLLDRWDLQFEPVGRRVFGELCPAAPRCAEHLGADPLAFFDRVMAALEGGQCASLGVDLPSWRAVFGLFLMDYNLRNWLPALVYRLDRCSAADQLAISTLLQRLFGAGGTALPRTSRVLQVHIVLSELFSRSHVDDADLVRARDEHAFFQDALAPMYQLQDTWPRYAEDPYADAYAPPSVPVLTLAGGDDPSAPPELVGYGYRDRLTGPHQTFAEIPFGAHTVLTTGSVGPSAPSCPVQLVRAFLADPTSSLPVGCTSQVLPPSFDAPESLLTAYWGTEDLYD